MEYLPLGNLAEQFPITEWETGTLLLQGLSALDYLHSRNIIHRDLKPENILVQCRERANFCIKIADFGLARNGSFLETLCGTKLYAAPEIWQNLPYTSKVDIWSLGLIAFQSTHSLPDFDHKRWYEILIQAINDSDSDGLLDFLKSSMLKTDPHMRLTASECLGKSAKLLEAMVPAQNLESDPGTPTEPMSSASMLKAFQAAGCEGGQMAAKRAETQSDFPTLSTLRAGGQPALTWDPVLENNDVPKEDEQGQEHVNSDVEDVSRASLCKRRRIEQPGEELLPNKQMSWRRYQDQVLIPSSNYIKMVLERKAVNMRQSDWWLNATEIITLAKKRKNERDHLIRLLQQHVEFQKVGNKFWISYPSALHLCKHLQLTDALSPLLNHAWKMGARPDGKPNPFELFLQVDAGTTKVGIRSKDLWINATHVVAAAAVSDSRQEIKQIQERVACEIVQGDSAFQGTYVDPLTGLQLCTEYNLTKLASDLQRILKELGWDQSQSANQISYVTEATNQSFLPLIEGEETSINDNQLSSNRNKRIRNKV